MLAWFLSLYLILTSFTCLIPSLLCCGFKPFWVSWPPPTSCWSYPLSWCSPVDWVAFVYGTLQKWQLAVLALLRHNHCFQSAVFIRWCACKCSKLKYQNRKRNSDCSTVQFPFYKYSHQVPNLTSGAEWLQIGQEINMVHIPSKSLELHYTTDSGTSIVYSHFCQGNKVDLHVISFHLVTMNHYCHVLGTSRDYDFQKEYYW